MKNTKIKSLIEKSISVINDNDEYATIYWKYGELKNTILELQKIIKS